MSDTRVEPSRVIVPPEVALERAVDEWVRLEKGELVKLLGNGAPDKSTVLKAHALGAMGIVDVFTRAHDDGVPVGVIVRELKRVRRTLKQHVEGGL